MKFKIYVSFSCLGLLAQILHALLHKIVVTNGYYTIVIRDGQSFKAKVQDQGRANSRSRLRPRSDNNESKAQDHRILSSSCPQVWDHSS